MEFFIAVMSGLAVVAESKFLKKIIIIMITAFDSLLKVHVHKIPG